MNGYLALLGVAITFGLFGVAINYNAMMFGDYFQVFLRNFGALLLLIPIIVIWCKPIKVSRTEFKILLGYSLITTLSFTLVSFAVLYNDIKEVLALRYLTAIFFSLILTVAFLHEKITRTNVWALSLATLGLIVFAYPFHSMMELVILLPIGAAITFVISNLIIKKITAPPESIMLVEFTTISVVLGLFILMTGQPTLVGYSYLSIAATAFFIVMLIVVTYWIVYGFRNSNFNVANIVMTSEIFFGLIFAYIFLGQTVRPLELLGISLIFIAAVLPNIVALRDAKKERRATPAALKLTKKSE